MQNTKKFSGIKLQKKWLVKRKLLILLEFQPILIGENKEQLIQLRTNNNVGHAGLSQPLAQLKDITTLEPKDLWVLLNKSSFLALMTAVKDAKEDGKLKLWNTLNKMDKSWSKNIHIHQVMEIQELANREDLLKFTFLVSPLFQRTLLNNWLLPSTKDQCQ